MWIPNHPCDQLTLSLDELGHQDRDLTVFRARLRQEVSGFTFSRSRIGYTDPHQSALGLVGDSVAGELENNRKANRCRGRRRRRCGLHQTLLRQSHAVGGNDLLRSVL